MPIDLETYSHELTLSQNGFYFFFLPNDTRARAFAHSRRPPARIYRLDRCAVVIIILLLLCIIYYSPPTHLVRR